MYITANISAEEVARAMKDDPEWGMDLLAELAERTDPAAFEREGNTGSRWHQKAGDWLRRLADAISSSK